MRHQGRRDCKASEAEGRVRKVVQGFSSHHNDSDADSLKDGFPGRVAAQGDMI